MASQPKPPDPYKQADAQNQQNAYSAFYNSVAGNANVNNPYGSTTSTISGYVPYTDPRTGKVTQVPQFTQNTTLSKSQQDLFDTENRVKQGMGNLAQQQIGQATSKLGTPFNTKGMQDWATYGAGPELVEPDEKYRQQMIDSIMASHNRNVAPQRSAEDAQFAARGMGAPGSKFGYSVAQGRGDVDAEAGRGAFQIGGEESRAAAEGINKPRQQTWLNSNARVDQGNALRQSQFGERSAERNQLINEISALMGGGQATIPNAPSWSGGQVNPFDIAGAQNNAYNIKAQNAANTNNAIFGALGNVMGAFNPLGRLFGK